jgi:hypothetical protein
MPIESDGHSKDNPRLFELIENAPKTGKSPTVWAWPQLVDSLKIAGQPVPGPWPQAVPDPHSVPRFQADPGDRFRADPAEEFLADHAEGLLDAPGAESRADPAEPGDGSPTDWRP